MPADAGTFAGALTAAASPKASHKLSVAKPSVAAAPGNGVPVAGNPSPPTPVVVPLTGLQAPAAAITVASAAVAPVVAGAAGVAHAAPAAAANPAPPPATATAASPDPGATTFAAGVATAVPPTADPAVDVASAGVGANANTTPVSTAGSRALGSAPKATVKAAAPTPRATAGTTPADAGDGDTSLTAAADAASTVATQATGGTADADGAVAPPGSAGPSDADATAAATAAQPGMAPADVPAAAAVSVKAATPPHATVDAAVGANVLAAGNVGKPSGTTAAPAAPVALAGGGDAVAGLLQPGASGAVGATADATPAPTLRVSAPVDSAEFAQGLSDRVSWMVDNNLNGAKLQVNPPQLGPIELRISVTGDHAQIWMSAHSTTTRDALQSSTPTLRDMLGAQGFGQVSVDISQRSFQEHSATPQPYRQAATPTASSAPTVAAAATRATPRSSSGSLDAYA